MTLYRETFFTRAQLSHIVFPHVEAKIRTGSFSLNLKHSSHVTPVRPEQMQISILPHVELYPYISIKTISAEDIGMKIENALVLDRNDHKRWDKH